MGYNKQGWKKRVKTKSGTLHYNSKKGLTYSSSAESGSKKTGYRYTVSADAGLPSGYIRVYETIKIGGAWKRKSKIQRTAVGMMMGCPPPYSPEYRARYGKKKNTTKKQSSKHKTSTPKNTHQPTVKNNQQESNPVVGLIWIFIFVMIIGSCVG